MEAIKIDRMAAQGDVLVRRVADVPPGMVESAPVGGKHVVAHSETGHHHYLMAAGVEVWEDPRNPLICYLRSTIGDEAGGAILLHDRAHHTHAPLALGAGCWEIRRQAEMTPEGWRRVAD